MSLKVVFRLTKSEKTSTNGNLREVGVLGGWCFGGFLGCLFSLTGLFTAKERSMHMTCVKDLIVFFQG